MVASLTASLDVFREGITQKDTERTLRTFTGAKRNSPPLPPSHSQRLGSFFCFYCGEDEHLDSTCRAPEDFIEGSAKVHYVSTATGKLQRGQVMEQLNPLSRNRTLKPIQQTPPQFLPFPKG